MADKAMGDEDESVVSHRTGSSRISVRLSAWWNVGVVAVVMGVLLLMFSPPIADPDLWGHVRFGQDLWQTGQIIRSDTYSYLTEGQKWINHEWLTEAIYGLLFSACGTAGLIAFSVVISLFIVGLLYRHLCRRGLNVLSAGMIIAFFALPLRPGVLNIRPQVFTYLLFLLVLLVIEAAERGADRWLASLLPIIALWVNLHGGVLAGVGIFLVWGCARLAFILWQKRRSRVLLASPQVTMLAIMVACPLALLLNPYRTELVAFLLRTATVPRPEIAEWQPITVTTTWGQLYFISLLLMLLGLVYSQRERRPTLIVVLACTAILPLLSARHTPLFALAVPALAGEHLADVGERWLPVRLSAWLTARFHTSYVVPFLFLATLILGGLAIPRLSHIQIVPASASFPTRAVALLKASGVGGNMVTEFNWGEYVLWHLGPRVKVSVDGRRETVYSESIYRENLMFMFGLGKWDRLLDRPETDMALVDRDRSVFNLMKLKPGWVPIYEDPLCGVFLREGSFMAEKIRQTSTPALPYDGRGLAFP